MTTARMNPAARYLVALDLDGTVLNHGHVGERAPSGDGGTGFAASAPIDPDLAEAIRTLHNAGHEVVIATGRSVDATLPIIEALGIRPEWVVCANGAVTLRRTALGDRGYRREYVEAFDATEILRRVRPVLAGARYGAELADGSFLYTDAIPSGTLPVEQRLVSFDELLGKQVSRVLVMSPSHRLEDFIDAAMSVGLSNVTYAVGDTIWLDIAPDGVSKESALEVVASRCGIAGSRVFAAGDGQNDIAMLRWAGRAGDSVAMGQANRDVRAAANRVTGTIEENGLLQALRERFPELLG
ncbi:HAD family hydrolase [Leucobacter sp. GX24907]